MDLDIIERRLKETTEGPWERSGDGVVSGPRIVCATGGRIAKPENISDAEFIAHSRQDISHLISEVKSLRWLLSIVADDGKTFNRWDLVEEFKTKKEK